LATKVYDEVDDLAPGHRHIFGLAWRNIGPVNAPDYARCRFRLIDLFYMELDTEVVVNTRELKGFLKVSSVVQKTLGGEHPAIQNACRVEAHLC
jgi:hypothetical protein